MSYLDELDNIYHMGDTPKTKEEWFRMLHAGQVCHADIVSLIAERDRLAGILSGDPHLTATKEQRETWRLSAVLYANEVDTENHLCLASIEKLETELKNISAREKALTQVLVEMRANLTVARQDNQRYLEEIARLNRPKGGV
jgi:hypothetical protein